MLKKVSFNYKGKKINVDAKACGYLEKISGLMFKSRKKAEALLFEFEKPVNIRIHSFFVFFPFVAIWLDEKNNVTELKEVRPFTLSVKTREPFLKFVEVPINEKYSKTIKFLFSRR